MNNILSFTLALACALILPFAARAIEPATPPKPDLTVSLDGTGNFTSIQKAIDSIPQDNAERTVIFIKNGTYQEHIRLNRSFVTLLGEDRAKTKIVWEINDVRNDPNGNADGKGIATFNLHNASDVVIDNLTIDNPAKLGGKPFVVFSTGTGTRVVIQNADITGLGGDSLSLWTRGLYYHRNLYVTGTYHFVGPRGTCYIADSKLECLARISNALFNEGMQDERQKFVMQRCAIVSKVPFGLGSHFRDAAWYFVDCEFPETLRPEGQIFIAQSNPSRPQPVSAMFKWATNRVYFANAKGPAYPWLRDNIEQSPAKSAAVINAAWTFSGEWDPESVEPPFVTLTSRQAGNISVSFSEAVTVKGKPELVLADGTMAVYQSGSGTATLLFKTGGVTAPVRLSLNGGAILASQASAKLRCVPDALKLP